MNTKSRYDHLHGDEDYIDEEFYVKEYFPIIKNNQVTSVVSATFEAPKHFDLSMKGIDELAKSLAIAKQKELSEEFENEKTTL